MRIRMQSDSIRDVDMRIFKYRPIVKWLLKRTGYKLLVLSDANSHRVGYNLARISAKPDLPYDMEPEFRPIYDKTRPFTMTPVTRMYSLYKAVQYIVKNGIPGDIVECGVWKGGSSMIAALTLLAMRDTTRRLWLYDTYEGMTEPSDKDVRARDGTSTHQTWASQQRSDVNLWTYSPQADVEANLYSTGYPKENILFIKGRVEDTIPSSVPNRIALLRLDTDWFQSTYHELNYLFPLLSQNGVVVLDDYGYYKGAREATDRYFSENKIPIFLTRVDRSGRFGLKIHT